MTSAFTSRLDGAVTGLAIKAPVKVATTANITLSGAQTIDGVAVTSGDRVLVKNQTTTTENGIYTVEATSWVRSADFSGSRDVARGTIVRVVSGTVHADQWWQVSTASPSIGSALAFSQVTDTLLAGFNQVTNWGAIGDGATDDTSALASAVAAAAAGGFDLYWPAGNYLTTASIPLLHTVRHFGGGVIVRGLDSFTVSPTRGDTNTLYVTTSGSTSNDGLSSSEPMTAQTAATALGNYGPALHGSWTISVAAGTYTRPQMWFPTGLLGQGLITVSGPSTGDFRTVPTAIFDGSSQSGTCIASSFLSRLKVKDIKLQNWCDTTPDFNAGSFAGVGLDAAGHTFLTLENVHAESCDCGVYVKSGVRYSAKGGIFTSCGAGVQELFSIGRDFKQAGETGNRTTFDTCTYGLKAKENCTGHVDYAEFLDCTYGVHFSRACSGNLSNAIFKRNTVGVYGMAGSSIVDLDVTWGTGADINGVRFSLDASSAEIMRGGGENAQSSLALGKQGKLIGQDVSTLAHTGTTNDTIVAIFNTTDIGDFQATGEFYEGHAYGSCSLASTATIRFRVGGNGASALTMPTGTYAWSFRWRFTSRGSDTQLAYAELSVGGSNSVLSIDARAYPFSTTSYVMGLYVQLVSGSDTVTVDGAHLFSSEM